MHKKDGRFIWPPVHVENQFPGKGELNFEEYLAALKRINYKGWVNVRAYPGYTSPPWPKEKVNKLLKESLEYLKSI